MAFRFPAWLRQMARDNTGAQWADYAARAGAMRSGQLSDLTEEAQALRGNLDRFLRRADKRVRLSRAALDAVPLPGGTDWRWRPNVLAGRNSPTGVAAPESGQRFGGPVVVWHDCPARALILRQFQNRSSLDLAAYGLRLEVLGFAGQYLSLSVDLPHQALEGLTKNNIMRLETSIAIERPIEIYARLNIQNGPNTEEILRHLGGMQPGQSNRHVTEFDLFTTEMNEKRLEKAWLDLIFENPGMNSVELRELIMSRHPRASV